MNAGRALVVVELTLPQLDALRDVVANKLAAFAVIDREDSLQARHLQNALATMEKARPATARRRLKTSAVED